MMEENALRNLHTVLKTTSRHIPKLEKHAGNGISTIDGDYFEDKYH